MELFDSTIERENNGSTALKAHNDTNHASKGHQGFQTLFRCIDSKLQAQADPCTEVCSHHAYESLPVLRCQGTAASLWTTYSYIYHTV
jgi:hypothetical protein